MMNRWIEADQGEPVEGRGGGVTDFWNKSLVLSGNILGRKQDLFHVLYLLRVRFLTVAYLGVANLARLENSVYC